MADATFNTEAGNPAVFLDRDGTLVRSDGYITRSDQICLLPDAAASIQRLRSAGFQCVLATNQSAIGRGLLSVRDLEEIHDELRRQLAAEGAELDAIRFCGHAPLTDDETVLEHPDRKPGPGMILNAAEDLSLNLSRSWMVGDRLSDVLAGVNAGCRSVRVKTGHRYPCPIQSIGVQYVTKYSIKEATDFILAESRYTRMSGVTHAGNSLDTGRLSGRVQACDCSAQPG